MNFHVEPIELVEVWNGIDANRKRRQRNSTIDDRTIVDRPNQYIVTQRNLTLLLELGSS